MKTNSQRKEMKILIKETLYNSLCQSIIKIAETPSNILKSFLFVCVLTLVGVCSFLVIQLILGYLSYEVTTATRTLYETPALFPKITICNVNPFTTEFAMEFLKQINQKLYPQFDIFNQTQMKNLNFTTKYDLIQNIKVSSVYAMNSLSDMEKKSLSHSLDDLMPTCSFNSLKCSAKSFTWSFDSKYGTCWIFNKEAPRGFNSFPGEFYGLTFNFYVDFYESLKTINSFNGGMGAVIRIGNSSYLTSYIPGDGIKVSTGHATSISLKRSFKFILPKPYSNCLIDNQTNSGFQSSLFELIQNSAYKYTQPLCFMQCFQRIILLKCNCTIPSFLSLFTNTTQCSTINECMRFQYDSLAKSYFFEENCFKECPLECYSNEFDVSLSSYDLVSDYFWDYLNSNLKLIASSKTQFLEAKQNFVSLNIFYKSLTYEMSTESPQTNWIWVFASVGGYLSLFLGLSIFSFVELVQLIIEMFILKLYKEI